MPEDLKPAAAEYKGKVYTVRRAPAKKECEDMIFGWLVESAVTSNSVIYVKDLVTVGIGTGEQDRVGVPRLAYPLCIQSRKDLNRLRKPQSEEVLGD